MKRDLRRAALMAFGLVGASAVAVGTPLDAAPTSSAGDTIVERPALPGDPLDDPLLDPLDPLLDPLDPVLDPAPPPPSGPPPGPLDPALDPALDPLLDPLDPLLDPLDPLLDPLDPALDPLGPTVGVPEVTGGSGADDPSTSGGTPPPPPPATPSTVVGDSGGVAPPVEPPPPDDAAPPPIEPTPTTFEFGRGFLVGDEPFGGTVAPRPTPTAADATETVGPTDEATAPQDTDAPVGPDGSDGGADAADAPTPVAAESAEPASPDGDTDTTDAGDTGDASPIVPAPSQLLIFVALGVAVVSMLVGVRSTVRSRRNDKLADIAFTDALTGLRNRRRMDADVAEQRNGSTRPTATLMIDVDHFKQFNDRYGHAMGDEVLRIVGDTLSRHFRRTDVPYRYGGEEFCVLLPETTEDEAMLAGERIRAAVEAVELPVDEHITVSIGVSIGPASEISDTLVRADSALYSAKEGGRNRVALA